MRNPALFVAAGILSTSVMANEFPAMGEARSIILETQRELTMTRLQMQSQRVQLEEARATPRGLSITLGTAFFESDTALKPVAQLMIARLARYLEANPSMRVRLEGYAGNGLPDSDATALQRSTLIGMDLARQGIASSRIHCTGQPGLFGDDPGRAVEVIFSAPDGRFAETVAPM